MNEHVNEIEPPLPHLIGDPEAVRKPRGIWERVLIQTALGLLVSFIITYPLYRIGWFSGRRSNWLLLCPLIGFLIVQIVDGIVKVIEIKRKNAQ